MYVMGKISPCGEEEEHGGREQKRQYGKGDEGERKGRVKKEAVKKLIIAEAFLIPESVKLLNPRKCGMCETDWLEYKFS